MHDAGFIILYKCSRLVRSTECVEFVAPNALRPKLLQHMFVMGARRSEFRLKGFYNGI